MSRCVELRLTAAQARLLRHVVYSWPIDDFNKRDAPVLDRVLGKLDAALKEVKG